MPTSASGTQVPSFDAPRHDPGDLVATRLHDGLPEAVAHPGIHRDLREERPDDRAERCLGDRAQRVQDGSQQLLAGVARLGDRDVRPRELDEQLQGQRLTGAPSAVDGGLADPGSGRHVLQAKAREPFLDEERLRRVEDGPMGPVAARAAPARTGARGRLGRSRMPGGHAVRLRDGASHCMGGAVGPGRGRRPEDAGRSGSGRQADLASDHLALVQHRPECHPEAMPAGRRWAP